MSNDHPQGRLMATAITIVCGALLALGLVATNSRLKRHRTAQATIARRAGLDLQDTVRGLRRELVAAATAVDHRVDAIQSSTEARLDEMQLLAGARSATVLTRLEALEKTVSRPATPPAAAPDPPAGLRRPRPKKTPATT